jgi:hypothetical protein
MSGSLDECLGEDELRYVWVNLALSLKESYEEAYFAELLQSTTGLCCE